MLPIPEVNKRPQDALYRAAAVPTAKREAHDKCEERMAPEDEQPTQTRATLVQDLRITVQDLEKFGHTDLGCTRCDQSEA